MSNPFFLDIETGGLDASKHVVSCIGVLDRNGVTQFAGENEREVLEEFNDWLAVGSDGVPSRRDFVTFNGAKFDFPFLADRARKYAPATSTMPKTPNERAATPFLNFTAWCGMMATHETHLEELIHDSIGTHVDLYEVLLTTPLRGLAPSLRKDSVCEAFEISVSESAPGWLCAYYAQHPEDVDGAFDVLEHNAADLFATRQLYLKFRQKGWLPEATS